MLFLQVHAVIIKRPNRYFFIQGNSWLRCYGTKLISWIRIDAHFQTKLLKVLLDMHWRSIVYSVALREENHSVKAHQD